MSKFKREYRVENEKSKYVISFKIISTQKINEISKEF